MDTIHHLRAEIKKYFPESSELQLLSSVAQNRRFNFYFQITEDVRFLIYLNWDGESNILVLKCLEFDNAEILNELIKEYPEGGSKTFNIGKPISTVMFIYHGENKLSVKELKGSASIHFDWNDVSGKKLMECVDPSLLVHA